MKRLFGELLKFTKDSSGISSDMNAIQKLQAMA